MMRQPNKREFNNHYIILISNAKLKIENSRMLKKQTKARDK